MGAEETVGFERIEGIQPRQRFSLSECLFPVAFRTAKGGWAGFSVCCTECEGPTVYLLCVI